MNKENCLLEFMYNKTINPYTNKIIKKDNKTYIYLLNKSEQQDITNEEVCDKTSAINYEKSSCLYKDLLNIIDSYNDKDEFYVLMVVFYDNFQYYEKHTTMFFNRIHIAENMFFEKQNIHKNINYNNHNFNRYNLQTRKYYKDVILFQSNLKDIQFDYRKPYDFYKSIKIIHSYSNKNTKFEDFKMYNIVPSYINKTNNFIFYKRRYGIFSYFHDLKEIYEDYIISQDKWATYFMITLNKQTEKELIKITCNTIKIKLPAILKTMPGYYILQKIKIIK